MVPERWSDDRLDDLAQQVRVVASLSTLVATHHAKIDGLDDSVKAGDAAHRQFVADSRASLVAWSEACDKKVSRLEHKIDAQAERAQANKWTPVQWAAILGPTSAALIGAVALLLTGGGS